MCGGQGVSLGGTADTLKRITPGSTFLCHCPLRLRLGASKNFKVFSAAAKYFPYSGCVQGSHSACVCATLKDRDMICNLIIRAVVLHSKHAGLTMQRVCNTRLYVPLCRKQKNTLVKCIVFVCFFFFLSEWKQLGPWSLVGCLINTTCQT